MKRSIKPTRKLSATQKRSTQRNLFAELSEGFEALANAPHDKLTLRTHIIEFKSTSTVTPQGSNPKT